MSSVSNLHSRSNAAIHTFLPRALPDFGILPEPDSREPWFICESHLSLDPSDIAGTVSNVLTELRR